MRHDDVDDDDDDAHPFTEALASATFPQCTGALEAHTHTHTHTRPTGVRSVKCEVASTQPVQPVQQLLQQLQHFHNSTIHDQVQSFDINMTTKG